MGKFSKDKGARVERLLVNQFKRHGIAASRVPLSGAMPEHPGDILIPWMGEKVEFEAKARADGFKEIYKWLIPRMRGLIIKANNRTPLVVLRLPDFANLLKAANEPKQASGYVSSDFFKAA